MNLDPFNIVTRMMEDQSSDQKMIEYTSDLSSVSIDLPYDVIEVIFGYLNSYELSRLPSVCETWNKLSIKVSKSRSSWPYLYNITKPNVDYAYQVTNIIYGCGLLRVSNDIYLKKEYHLFVRLNLDCHYDNTIMIMNL